jgi:deferrochelatase/peroxidase EfeB
MTTSEPASTDTTAVTTSESSDLGSTAQTVQSTAPEAAKWEPRTGPQAGILNRPPEHLLVAAFTLTGSAPRDTVESLRAIVEDELTSVLAPDADPTVAPPETGELGYQEHHDRAHLTITVGFSTTGYDKLGIAAGDRPADLITIPWGQLGDSPDVSDSGDIVLQICADNAYVIEHVLRRVERTLAGQVQTAWAHTGAQRYTSRPGRTAKHEGRAWIGFLDGTSNLQPGKDDGDRALTFVDPDASSTYPTIPASGQPSPYGPSNQPIFPADLRPFTGTEPAWTRNGSYLCARVSVNDLPTWDAQTLTDQEATIGRHKKSGISLDLDNDPGATVDTPPAFATDQTNEQVAITAHIRRANPRGSADDLARRIFRRGYPLYEGGSPTLRRGLVFLAYGRTVSTQFEFIFRGWITNPNFPRPGAGVDRLRQFDTHVLAGGYYFVPPLDDERRPWSWHVPQSTVAAQ